MNYVATKGSTFSVSAGTWSGVGTIGSSTVSMGTVGGKGDLKASYKYSKYCKIDGQPVVYSISVEGELVVEAGAIKTTTPVNTTLDGSTKYVKDGSSWLLEGDSKSSSITIKIVERTPTGTKTTTTSGTQKISIETTQTNTKAE